MFCCRLGSCDYVFDPVRLSVWKNTPTGLHMDADAPHFPAFCVPHIVFPALYGGCVVPSANEGPSQLYVNMKIQQSTCNPSPARGLLTFPPSEILCSASGNERSFSHRMHCDMRLTWSFTGNFVEARILLTVCFRRLYLQHTQSSVCTVPWPNSCHGHV